jgi:hypothetical protein
MRERFFKDRSVKCLQKPMGTSKLKEEAYQIILSQ